ncbi:hypothetical protein BJ684DRAFT_16669 [Piptocephalis cylindrospora]|uniref:Uncharacterized protein n=1 Tax=Piptocephalis cylindrospora TaxID=1907219 RepID=A0A4P9Y434_9FUNG|nr:hypothetical protein BJ684DRAFT_16669 [Piptocephalis cylindrospora]|eukprot:RKP12891.1 hypothetical protein BJ684DRAFT_16669 [Piptocephalis cylindrospora]
MLLVLPALLGLASLTLTTHALPLPHPEAPPSQASITDVGKAGKLIHPVQSSPSEKSIPISEGPSEKGAPVSEAPSPPEHGFLYNLGDGIAAAAITGPIFQAPSRSANEAMTRALAPKYAASDQEYEDAVLKGKELLEKEGIEQPEALSPLDSARKSLEEMLAYKSEKKGHARRPPLWAKHFYEFPYHGTRDSTRQAYTGRGSKWQIKVAFGWMSYERKMEETDEGSWLGGGEGVKYIQEREGRSIIIWIIQILIVGGGILILERALGGAGAGEASPKFNGGDADRRDMVLGGRVGPEEEGWEEREGRPPSPLIRHSRGFCGVMCPGPFLLERIGHRQGEKEGKDKKEKGKTRDVEEGHDDNGGLGQGTRGQGRMVPVNTKERYFGDVGLEGGEGAWVGLGRTGARWDEGRTIHALQRAHPALPLHVPFPIFEKRPEGCLQGPGHGTKRMSLPSIKAPVILLSLVQMASLRVHKEGQRIHLPIQQAPEWPFQGDEEDQSS